jgi:hypothetical protein
MATIYSSDLKLSIMATGENAGTWGQITNTNLYLIQQAIGGYESISIAGGAQTTALTMSNGAISNARNAVIKLTGTITGNQIVTIPNGIEKTYIVSNGTTGAFTVEFKTASGTGVTFSTIDKSTKILFADGTNIVDTGTVSETGVQTLTNKTLTSPIINEIDDANGNEQIIFSSTASAINELTITNAAAGNAPSIATTGGDTNIGLTIAPKGTGDVNIDADTVRIGDSNADATITTNGTGDITISTNSGTNSGTVKIFDGVNGNIEITPNGTGVVKLDGLSYPTADGTANQVLQTNGSGILSFATLSGGTPTVNTFDTGTAATYTKPTTANWMLVELWGGGGSGGRSNGTNAASGGGGGSYNYAMIPFADLVGDVTYTVGAGGAGKTTTAGDGNVGGTSSISFANFQGLGTTKTVSAFGGGGGTNSSGNNNSSAGGGGGGTPTGAGSSGASNGGNDTGYGADNDTGASFFNVGVFGGGGNVDHGPCTVPGNFYRAGASIFGGGGGGGGKTTTGGAGGNTVYGGGGGSGARSNTGGTSIWGGNGSNGVASGTVSAAGGLPAGGSAGAQAANSGNGGGGRVRFTYW